MSVRYKFRSSVSFDSVDIDGRPSISIRELKSKIVRNKKLNICQDFDLLFCDALTGQEYAHENFQIASGSSVIIKRVPAGTVPSDIAHDGAFANFGIKDVNEFKTPCPTNVEINFDDFGVDFCPIPEATLSCSDTDIGKKSSCDSKGKYIDATRCPEQPMRGCKKLEASDFTEVIPRGPVHSGVEENTLEVKSKPYVQQCKELEKVITANPPALQSTNFPSELKCSLCNTLFKEAMMIPCCQHSFCEICIRQVLVEKARCPKCFSSKCRVQDLLPNVSLQYAIEHFLESQILIGGSENALHHYAPDGESGIQAKDASCAATNLQREPELSDSPPATGRGSNQIVAKSACDSLLRNNVLVGGTGSCVNQLGGKRHGSAHPLDFESRPAELNDFADCHGESQPINEEAESSIKKKRGLFINTAGVDKSFMESGRYKKGNRTCYMCGSPDHFIRDCPAALSPNPLLQTGNASFPRAMHGYVSAYWNGPPLPHVRPFANIYGSPGMMPYNAAMVPPTPFVPTYMPSMFHALPAYSGYMTMGGATTPVGINMKRDHQDYAKKQKLSYGNISAQSSDDGEDDKSNRRFHFDEAERLHDHRSHVSRERSASYSENSFTHRSHKRHWRDNNVDNDRHYVHEKNEKDSHSSISGTERRPYHHSDKLSSEVEDVPSSSNWHGDEKHRNHGRNSKKQNESRDQCCSDSSWAHHANKEKYVERKRQKSDVKRHHHNDNSRSESDLEPSYSSDKKKRSRERDFGNVLRHSRHNSKFMDDELCHDRWMMVRGSDENSGEDHRYSKEKRVYQKKRHA